MKLAEASVIRADHHKLVQRKTRPLRNAKVQAKTSLA